MQNLSQAVPSANPLAAHFRQASLYLKLPSLGRYWLDGSINLPLNNEIPIFPMTTKDEITLKTPDALLNGQGVIDVIQSCCPNIIDAWQMPTMDADAILIAIRIASYGNRMEITSTCPHCNEKQEKDIDLQFVLASIKPVDYTILAIIDNLKIKMKPQTYYEANRTNLISFEEQQIVKSLEAIQDGTPEADAAKLLFEVHINKLIKLNYELLTNGTEYIELEDGTVVRNQEHLLEFYTKTSSHVTRKTQKFLTDLVTQAKIKPISVICSNEECAKEFDLALEFDYSSFFDIGS